MSSSSSTPGDSEVRVDLKLVDESDPPGESQPNAEASLGEGGTEAGDESRQSARRGLPVWLFGVALLVFAVGYGWQLQRVGELEADVAGLTLELDRTSTLLDTYHSRLAEIRGGVRELSAHLEGLRALVDSDPAVVAPESAVATP